MIVEIRNYLSASFLLQNQPCEWAAIVILDSGCDATKFVAEHTTEHLILHFDDITEPVTGKRLADTESIQSALAFAADKKKVVVSCRAGQSRSAAVAHAICFQNNGPDATKRLLNPRRHIPNRHVIEIAGQLLDDPGYLHIFDRWSREHAAVRLRDYVDEIEAEYDALEDQGAKNSIVTKRH